MGDYLFRCLLALAAAVATVSGASVSDASPAQEQALFQGVAGLDTRAVVTLAYFDRSGQGASVQWPRVAFAIGDGTLLLTAAHCVDDLRERAARPVAAEIVVISPYYGDAFGFEIVAVDKEADVAVLRASWPAHPALALATAEELAAARRLLIVSRPSVRHEKPYRLGRRTRGELLPVIEADGTLPNQAIQLEGAQKVTHGWSGSAIVLPDTGRVVGVLGQINRTTVRRLLFLRMPHVDALGCGIESIDALLGQHGLEAVARRPVPPLETIPDGLLGFSLAMDCLEALLNSDADESIESARELTGLRPESARTHLMRAYGAAVAAQDANAPVQELRAEAAASFERALVIEPNSAHAHAAYGDFLMESGRNAEALAQVEAALKIDPEEMLSRVSLLPLLRKTDPNRAFAAGERAVACDPNNPYLWFHHSVTLLNLDRPEKALDAAQRAVDLDPNGLFYSPLADALTALDRLDEAETCYRRMAERCGCQSCWYKYAAFLVNRRKDRWVEAAEALEKAEAKVASNRVSRRQMNGLKLRVLEKTAPPEAEDLVRHLLAQSPAEPQYWWHLAAILRTQERYDEAVLAARKAVNLNPEGWYRPRLANCLGKAGDLAAAEEAYDEMLARHPERPLYWYWYAQFLLDYFPNRTEEAAAAAEQAMAPSDSDWSVSHEDLRELEARLTAEPIAQ